MTLLVVRRERLVDSRSATANGLGYIYEFNRPAGACDDLNLYLLNFFCFIRPQKTRHFVIIQSYFNFPFIYTPCKQDDI